MTSNLLFYPNIPIRYDYYQQCAETWSRILKHASLKKVKTVCDLASGWAPKIPLALMLNGFRGTYWAIDKNDGYLKNLASMMSIFKIAFIVKTKRTEKLTGQAGGYDLIILNHALDDLMIGQCLATNHISPTDCYQNIANFRHIWKQVDRLSVPLQNELIGRLLNFFRHTLSQKGFIIIAQYRGYQEKLYRLNSSYRLSRNLLTNLNSQMLRQYQPRPDIITQTLTPLFNGYFNARDCFCWQLEKSVR
jgi:hypothetical protein